MIRLCLARNRQRGITDRVSLVPLSLLLTLCATQAKLSATDTGELELDPRQLSVSQLETRLVGIDAQLKSLAKASMRTGIGAVGYRSATHQEAENTEWIQIELERGFRIDQIVLVPTIFRDTEFGFQADGFPLEFRVVVGSENTSGKVIANITADDQLLPRVAPVVIRCSEHNVAWIRVEATTLSPRAWDGKYILQLSEIAVFSGEENVALHAVIDASSDDTFQSRSLHHLVDGFVPYLMDAQEGMQSIAFVSEVGIGDQVSLSIDLGESRELDRIHLHSTDLSDTVPQAESTDFGIPRWMIVEGSLLADFSDAVPLTELRIRDVFDTGPIIMRRFPKQRCRYVRLNVLEPYHAAGRESETLIGFAEIELFSSGRNVALALAFNSDIKPMSPLRSLSALTDGNNLYGRILPLRAWLGQLALRHDLETMRPLVATELRGRYQQQRTNMRRLIALTVSLGLGAVFAILIGWVLRQRAVLHTRQRIAADIHDELGANIHAIGLLSDLAKNASDSPEKLKPVMQRMRELTQRTGTAASYCANMLESAGLFDDLEQEMRRSSARILADHEHELTIKDEGVLRQLKPQNRIDLFLFHKECLTNILRHSEATRVETSLSAEDDLINLTIQDNGIGIAGSGVSPGNGVPPSLQRRARLLGASVSVDHPECGGTCVSLAMRLKKRRLFF